MAARQTIGKSANSPIETDFFQLTEPGLGPVEVGIEATAAGGCWSRRRWLSATLLAAGGSMGMCAYPLGCLAQEPSKFVRSSTLPSGQAPLGPLADELESFEIHLTPLRAHESSPVVTALAASHDGRFLAAAGDDHAIRVIDVVSGHTFSTLTGHTDWIQSIVFSADSQRLYSTGNDGRVLKWNHQYPVSSQQITTESFALRDITLSSEKDLLAICGFSDQVLLWDLAGNRLRHRLHCESQDQRCVRFSPDGSQLLRGGRLGEICVWDTASGEELAHYRKHNRRVFTAAFSADGTEVTSVGEDRRLIRYNLASQQVTFDREIAKGKLMSMCMINDNMVAAAGADNSVHLVDILAGDVVAQLKGHSGTVAVMVACGDFLASGSYDTTIRIWNLERIGEHRGARGKPVVSPMKVDTNLRIR